MGRQVSDSYIAPAGVGDQAALASTPFTLGDVGHLGDEAAALEAQVAYIVAKIFVASSSRVGFPAFGAGKRLLGFYRDVEDAGSRRVGERLEFLPVGAITQRLSEETVRGSPHLVHGRHYRHGVGPL